jgi:hypothetical protein
LAPMDNDQQRREAAVRLTARTGDVAYAADPDRWRRVLLRFTRGRCFRERWFRAPVARDAPWQDVPSFERAGWRERSALLDGDQVSSVEYVVCRRCRLGWVEAPYTHAGLRRVGLAAAALGAPGVIIQVCPGIPSAGTATTRGRSGIV